MDTLALVLLILGAINLGIRGLFQIDLLGTFFGSAPEAVGGDSVLTRIISTMIGLAGIWSISLFFRKRGREKTADE